MLGLNKHSVPKSLTCTTTAMHRHVLGWGAIRQIKVFTKHIVDTSPHLPYVNTPTRQGCLVQSPFMAGDEPITVIDVTPSSLIPPLVSPGT